MDKLDQLKKTFASKAKHDLKQIKEDMEKIQKNPALDSDTKEEISIMEWEIGNIEEAL